MITHFAKLLRDIDPEVTDEDIADVLWLALHMRPSQSKGARAIPNNTLVPSEQEKKAPLTQESAVAPDRNQETSVPEPTPIPQIDQPHAELHFPPPENSKEQPIQKRGLPFRSPIVTPLPGSLAIERSLRPLLRCVPSRTRYTINEEMTAQLLAEQLLARQPILFPALQPVPLKWLDVALLIDESKSMSIWQTTVAAFKHLIERHGAFRDVRAWGLLLNADNEVSIRPWGTNAEFQRLHNPAELLDPRGQRLILVLSDCISDIWYHQALSQTIKMWGSKGPVAILQVLPQRLWPRSALGDAIEVQMHARFPASPNRKLDYEPASYLIKKRELKGMFPVPIVALQPYAFGQWIRATIKAENAWAPGYAFDLQLGLQPPEKTSNLTQRQLVQRFSSHASPLARHLLGLLASAPINLSVIRLIQHTMLPQSDLDHVAEILLGGLIEQSPINKFEYDFVDGVRDLLIQARPKSEALQVLLQVSDFLKDHVGQSLDIRTLLADPNAANGLIINSASRPFAVVAKQVFSKLGGEYEALAKHLENSLTVSTELLRPDLSTANALMSNTDFDMDTKYRAQKATEEGEMVMATQDHMERLRQGSDSWNKWRKENRKIRLNLSGADLNRADLREVDLKGADLRGADLKGADLSFADLSEADLSFADLFGTNLNEANLSRANLSEAQLRGANLIEANLIEANLSRAYLHGTILAKADLRTTKGLATIQHTGASHIELFSVQLPQDGSSLHFLRGAGVPDEWIDFWRTSMIAPIHYHSCFIAYASQDELLARRLYADLQAEGVRCWFAPKDMKIGDNIRRRIDESIQLHEKMLLLLSQHSFTSDWVELEVEAALAKEKQQEREVLFPVRLDEAVMNTTQAWAKHLRINRHIGDFTKWETPQAYQAAFARLLRDLKQGATSS